MRKPRYFVSFSGINLHGVTDFQQEHSRDIDDYDGIGSGKFNVPGTAEPRKWTINCTLYQEGMALDHSLGTWRASEIFKLLDTYCGKTDAPVRKVKTDADDSSANLSVLVWVKSYSGKESGEQGTYDTEIEVEEYKPAGIKTTGIPTVRRPGKIPVPPKVTITKKNTVYRVKKKYGKKATLRSTKTGKPVKNDALPKGTYVLRVAKPTPVRVTNTGGSPISFAVKQPPKQPTYNVFYSIGESLKKFLLAIIK